MRFRILIRIQLLSLEAKPMRIRILILIRLFESHKVKFLHYITLHFTFLQVKKHAYNYESTKAFLNQV
jgi:hypothetical protein